MLSRWKVVGRWICTGAQARLEEEPLVMFSISPGMTAGQAGSYFSREDYYLRDAEQGENSLWYGKGAQELGLSGPVGEEEFRALCRGEDPEGNRIVAPKLTRDRETGEQVEQHRAGNDGTFSAPKSVSVAYCCGVPGIKEAHDAAVLSVLEHVEEHLSRYRSPEGMLRGELVVAKFDHATSRNIDPQLHSHCFFLNAVRAADGSWRANEPRVIFQDQKSLGLLYRQALAHELRERGFGVEILDRRQMFFELKGVDPRLIEFFSSRRAEIERKVGVWKGEGRFPGVSHGQLYEMAALETRDPKREIKPEEVRRSFERGFEACGTSREQVRRELERGLSLSRERETREPPGRVVELAVRDLTEREAVLDRARLLDQAVRVSGGRHGVRELDGAIDSGEAGVLGHGRDARGRELCTTREMLELESRNLARIRELPPFVSLTSGPEVETWLAGCGVRLTAGQKMEVVNELAGSRGAALTVGDPGTVKTRTLGVVERFNEEVLVPRGEGHVSINLGYTGKAARELGLATGRPSCTISSFLAANPASKFELQRANGEPAMVMVAGENILMPEGTQAVLRVDEASLLGARQAEELIRVVEELRGRGVQAKLHLIGDSKQMQAISAGDLLRQVQELGVRGEVDYTHMTEILRQRDPELLEIARGLNREDRPLAENAREALASLERQGRLVEIADPQELVRAARDRYLAESREPSRIPERAAAGERQQVLLVAASNAERKELNCAIREARVLAGEIGEGRSYPVLAPVRQGITVEGYRPGDTLLFTGTRGEDGRMERWGARLNTEGRVTGIDRERNLVQIEYSFHTKKKDGRELSRTVQKEFPAAELAGRTALYREEERQFAVGDRIVALKNEAKLDLQNGAMGTIRELDERGRALVDLGDRQIALDLTKYRQLDHAYAVTIHKSQGATVEHSIMFAAVRPERERMRGEEPELSPAGSYGRASYNALNVAVTRAQFGAHVYTNSIEGLARSVELVDEKSSTLKKVPALEREPGHEPPGRDWMRVLEQKIGELERMVRGPRREPGLEKVLPPLAVKLPVPAPAVQKEVGRQLERALKGPGKGFGFGE
jgi:conjugative relaxase-like TrwC/TraI family protein